MCFNDSATRDELDLLPSVMSYKHFQFLVCQMPFDDSATRDEQQATDRFATQDFCQRLLPS